MQVSPTYSITPPKKQELYTPEHLESLAVQYSMAQGDISNNTLDLNRLRLQNGDEEFMKSELVQKTNADRKAISANILDVALKEGNVDLAENVVRGNVPQETQDMVVPNLAAEYAAVIKDSDTSHVTTPEDLGLDTQKNARLLALNNALNEVMSDYDRAYGISEEEFKTYSDVLATAGGALLPMGAPFAAAAQPKAARMGKDTLMMFINSIYSFSKSGISFSFFFPGSQSKITSSELFDPSITDEEFNKRLNVVRDNVRNYYGSDDFKNNPLAATSLLIDSLGTGQLDNPEFMELAEIKNVVDEQGRVQENLLGKILDPNSKLMGFFMEPIVQNIIDNPIFDIPFGATAIDLFKVVFGSSAASQILAQQIKTGKVTAQNWRYLTQMNYPAGIQDPELLANVQRRASQVESGLETSVEALRVEATPIQIAAEQTKLQRTEFSGKDLAYFEHIVEQNNQFIGVNLQARSGNPFFSEASARQAATARGFTDYKVVPSPRGNGFFIQIRRSVDETGLMDSTLPKDPLFVQTLFGLGKYMHSPQVTGTRSQRFGGSSSASNVAGYAKLFNPMIETFSTLSSRETKALGSVILKGMRTAHPSDPSGRTLGKWFSDKELNQEFLNIHQRPATFAERDAYQAYRQAYDLDYLLMNKAKRDRFAAMGLNHYNFEGITNLADPVLGKVVENTGAIAEDSRFLLSTGQVVDKSGAGAAIANPDNIVISVYGRMSWGDNEITHIVHKRNSTSSSGLNKFVLGYTEGGTRRYAEPFLVKQEGINGGDITHAIFPSQKKAIEYASRMEGVAQAVRDYRVAVRNLGPNSNAQAINALRRQYDATIQAAHDGYTLQRVEDEILRGKFNPNSKFDNVFDGEGIPREGIVGDPNLQSHQYKGGLYYSPRGEHLTDGYIGQYAELVSPFEALSDQLSHATRMAGYNDFAIKEVNAWMAKYGKYIEIPPSVRFPSPEQMFREGTWRKNIRLSPKQREIAEAQRMHILRETGHIDGFNARVVEFKTEAAKAMAVSLGDLEYAKWLPDAVRRGTIVSETDAVNFLKSVNYVLKMGMFYPTQFFLQASSSFLAAARGGMNGIPALKDASFILMAGASDFNNKVVKLLDTRASLALGYKKGEFTKVLYDWQRTQLKEIGRTEGTLDVVTNVDALSGPITRFFKKGDEYGRLFTYKGEEFVNATTFGIARREAIDLANKGKFQIGSDEYIYWIRGRSNELQSNPRSGVSFWWQRNDATSLAMQMLNWVWKQTETFLFLDREVNTAERLRFIAAAIALYGASGFPGGTTMADLYYKYARDEEDPPSIEELKNVYQGGLDSFFRNVLGMDPSFASRMGPGTLFTTLYTDIFDTKTSMFETLAGITSSTVVDLFNLYPAIGEIIAVAKLRNAESSEVNWASVFDAADLTFSKVAGLSSSWSTMSKAYLAERVGFEVNRKKNAISNYDSGAYPTFLKYLGIQSGDEFISYKLNVKGKERDQLTWDFASSIVEARIQYQFALNSNDISAMNQWEVALQIISQQVPNGMESEVDSKAASIMRNDTTQKRLKEAAQNGFIK